ncbi:MAG TPA: hypothetical protein VG826_12135 [Pirellulales bacterium]|nr:hypothetical protein [Pirellulales bacterium]
MAKQSRMRALLTIGKMGKRFQENEPRWRFQPSVVPTLAGEMTV